MIGGEGGEGMGNSRGKLHVDLLLRVGQVDPDKPHLEVPEVRPQVYVVKL